MTKRCFDQERAISYSFRGERRLVGRECGRYPRRTRKDWNTDQTPSARGGVQWFLGGVVGKEQAGRALLRCPARGEEDPNLRPQRRGGWGTLKAHRKIIISIKGADRKESKKGERSEDVYKWAKKTQNAPPYSGGQGLLGQTEGTKKVMECRICSEKARYRGGSKVVSRSPTAKKTPKRSRLSLRSGKGSRIAEKRTSGRGGRCVLGEGNSEKALNRVT